MASGMIMAGCWIIKLQFEGNTSMRACFNAVGFRWLFTK